MTTNPLSRIAFLLLAALCLAVSAQGQAPETIAYQGYLTNADGDAAQGSAAVVFRLYDQASGGTALWEETQQNVTFTDGLFTVHLGAVESLEAVSFDQPLWLGVAIAGSAELAPRVALEAVPYALSVRGLRVVPGVSQNTPSPALIGGYAGNVLGDGADGAVIGGGGSEGLPNVAAARFAAVGGGLTNQANAPFGTVGGGYGNVVDGEYAVIAGGNNNTAPGLGAAVAGGIGNRAEALHSVVGGGLGNFASGERATIGGGGENRAQGRDATVGGGRQNVAGEIEATVGGGFSNEATEQYTTVGGGSNNTASLDGATVSGGEDNTASGSEATVGGGVSNTASGTRATVPGGASNVAAGRGSFSAGERAKANHDGAFVWSDGIDQDFASTADRQFLIRARGGVGIGTNAPQGALHVTDEALGVDANDISSEALVVEGDVPVIGVYARFQSNTRPGIVLAGVDGGNVVDKWGIVREYFGNNRLLFSYGLNEDHTQNQTVLSLSATGGPSAERFTATQDLGANGTPTPGGHFRDNVVYAWAHVNADGSVTASYGCEVSKITGFGRYRVEFKRQLPNGASAIVTARTLNDPVMATAVTNANQADVATKVFNGAAFVFADYGFYIQVVGRP
ncbi:MAG: hypothetical protein GVY18_08425 [Bacteroidetes bacterium]|jgi:hypothetical protein|nr:hypothetical protein [Bacteroidota bacterium]